MDYSSSEVSFSTQPLFRKEARELAGIMKKKSAKSIQKLMELSENLAVLNEERYKHFVDEYTLDNSKQALLAFKGDVYTHIDVESFTKEDFDFAQEHLRILSGLYGLLRPMDLIQPYRLEMGTRLKTKRGATCTVFGEKRSLNRLIRFPRGSLL